MRVNGLVPILTHPERNSTLQRSPASVCDRGCRPTSLCRSQLARCSAPSALSRKKSGGKLVRNHWAHFVSSDAHNLTRRSPKLRDSYAAVSKRHGEDTAERLFVTNPLAVYEGRPMPPQPEPTGIYEGNTHTLAGPPARTLPLMAHRQRLPSRAEQNRS